MDGYETTKFIRESLTVQYNQVFIVAMTANAVKGDKERCLAAGMNEYLRKPINSEKLESMLNSFLQPDLAQPSSHRSPVNALNDVHFDRMALEKLAALNAPGLTDIVSELILDFFQSTPLRLQNIQDGTHCGDWEKVREEAHALKSSSAALGAKEFSGICKNLEKLCCDKDTAALPQTVDRLVSAFQRAKKYFSEIQNSRLLSAA